MKALNLITQQESGDLELTHPKTGEGLGSFLVLAGPKHPVRERLELDNDRRIRQQINKRGALELDEPEEDRRKALDFLVACTLGWYTIEKAEAIDGQPSGETRIDAIDVGNGPEPFSIGRVREIYQDKSLAWIRTQARQGVNSGDLFIKDSSRPSPNSPAGSPASPQ